MKARKLLIAAALAIVLGLADTTARAQAWLGANLGSPSLSGSVTTNLDGTLTIIGGGDDIWNQSDNGYYYSTWAYGTPWEAVVRVRDIQSNTDVWGKCELMVRASDPAVGVQGNDAFIAAMATATAGQNELGFQFRSARNNSADRLDQGPVRPSYPDTWMRITRTNNVFAIWFGTDGSTWTLYRNIDTGTPGAIVGQDAGTTFNAPFPDLVHVGVAVTAHNNGDADGVVATISDLRANFSGITAPTTITADVQVTSKTVIEGGEAVFAFHTVNNAVPNVLNGAPYILYQWYRNGSPMTGCTKTSIALLASMADDGDQFHCVATIQPPYNSTVTGLTSATGTLGVTQTGVLYTGALKMEVFAGSTRNDAYIGNVPDGGSGPDGVAGKLRWLTAFEDPANDPLYGDNTTRRHSGWFIPTVGGNYNVFVAADDDTDVYLSTDATMANKQMVCQEPGWSGYNNWTNAGDGTDLVANLQKNSKTWTNGLGVSPYNLGIPLTANQRYYFEVIVHNGGGGDNCSVTAQLYDDPDPANGSPTAMRDSNIQLVTWQPTAFSWAQQPASQSVSEGQTVIFTARATSDGEFAPHYQWYRNSTPVTGATRSSFSIGPLVGSDNNAQIFCRASIPLMSPIDSQTATLTVVSAIFEPGFMLNEKWSGQNRQAVENGTYGLPNLLTNALPGMGAGLNGESGSTYTRKISGFFIPPATDNYDFWTTSDDQSDLFISTDDKPANKRMIAQETSWSNPNEWNSSQGGGAVDPQKSSQTFVFPGNASATNAGGVRLNAGVRYYMEVVMNEGGGGDNVSVTWSRKLAPYVPVNGDQPLMVGNVIGFLAPKVNWVRFTQQPVAPPPIQAGGRATFTAFGDSDSKIAVGAMNVNDSTVISTQFVFFQWFKNGASIPGATASTYTTPMLKPADDNAQFMCQMRALGYGIANPQTRFWSNSAVAQIDVITDPTVPTVNYSAFYVNNDFIPARNCITVSYSILMDPLSVTNPATYTLPAGVALDGSLSRPIEVNPNDLRHVTIFVTGTPTFPANLTVNNALSWSGISAGATRVVAVSQQALTPKNLGNDSGDPNYIPNPAFPGRMWPDGPRAYTIAAQGSDIWDVADGFNFLYEQKNGDFDVVLRQKTYSLPNRWAKVGLMLRDEISAGSRNWNIVNDPPDVPTLSDGNGANAVELNWRAVGGVPTGGASAGWGNGTGRAPTYPNAWVRLKREGQVVSAYCGSNGQTWTEMARMDVSTRTDTIAIPTSMYIGICVTAHHNDGFNPLDPYPPMDNQQFWNYTSVDNYNSSYVLPPVLTITRSGANVICSWTPTGGNLQRSSNLTSWTTIGTANPSAPIPAGTGTEYFRVLRVDP